MATATTAPKGAPLDDWLLVEDLAAPGQSKGGILLPDVAKKRSCRGRVLSVGPGKIQFEGEFAGKRRKPDIRADEEILYGEWCGAEVEIDGSKYRMLRESDVMYRFT